MTAWMAVLRWGGVFFATKRIRPLSQSEWACVQGSFSPSAALQQKKQKKSSQMCQFLEF